MSCSYRPSGLMLEIVTSASFVGLFIGSVTRRCRGINSPLPPSFMIRIVAGVVPGLSVKGLRTAHVCLPILRGFCSGSIVPCVRVRRELLNFVAIGVITAGQPAEYHTGEQQ